MMETVEYRLQSSASLDLSLYLCKVSVFVYRSKYVELNYILKSIIYYKSSVK